VKRRLLAGPTLEKDFAEYYPTVSNKVLEERTPTVTAGTSTARVVNPNCVLRETFSLEVRSIW
jgi:hypothetical protein